MKKIKRKFDLVYAVGDVHGNFEEFNSFLHGLVGYLPDKKIGIVQCGDFCLWEEVAPLSTLDIPENVEVFVCPGNHENWDWLDTFEYNITEVAPKVWYMPFGSVLNVNEKTNILFCGKADSIDKHLRKEGVSWWPQENISSLDMDQLSPSKKIDVVISHTAPNYFDLGNHYKNTPEYKDPSRDELDKVWDMYKPKAWYFGHFHVYKYNNFKGTQWHVLDTVAERDYWKYIMDVAHQVSENIAESKESNLPSFLSCRATKVQVTK